MDNKVNLKKIWNSVIATLPIDDFSCQREWQKLYTLYTQKGRFYHDLSHLTFMFNNLEAIEYAITNKTAVWLAVFYHDAVYTTKASDNEEQSADLRILGEPWDDYITYYHNIRKEYFWVHDDEYKKGRSKVLQLFLQRSRIYLTEQSYQSHENQARKNMIRELHSYL